MQGQMGSMSVMPQSITSPPGPPQQNKERTGLCWALPPAALAQAPVCQCADTSAFFKARIHAEAPKMGFLRVPRSPHTEASPLLSPPWELFLEDMNSQQVQSTPERPLTSNVTLGFQFSFCLALVQSPCRKSCGTEERGAARTVTFPTLTASPLLLLPSEPSTGQAHYWTLPRTNYS